jgi:hypothetical protein
MTTTTFKTSDYLTTDEILRLTRYFRKEGNYRMCLLIEFGVKTLLRYSDLSRIKWIDVLGKDTLVLNEKKKSNEDRPPPELLFNIDGDRSMVTIHDKSRKQEASNSGPKKISKVAFEVDESSSSSSSYVPKKKSTVAYKVDDSSNSKSENDNSSSSSSLDGGESNKGSTPSLSNARSNSTAPKVIEHTALTLDNAQDSTMGG